MSGQPASRPEFQSGIRLLSVTLKSQPIARSWDLQRLDECSPMTAMMAHMAFVSNFGNLAIYRMQRNFSGIPWHEMWTEFGATPGTPDDQGAICKFPDTIDFVNAYVAQHQHTLILGAKEFLAHMRACDMSPNAGRRWQLTEQVWEKSFAGRSSGF